MNHATERIINWSFVLLFAFVLVNLTRGPTERVRIDPDGAHIERSAWWGMSRTIIPLKLEHGTWYRKEADGSWSEYVGGDLDAHPAPHGGGAIHD